MTPDLGSVSGGVPGSAGYQARVQWGDGTAPGDATVDGSGKIAGSHTYAQAGTYTVHVTVWDAQSSVTVPFTVTVSKVQYQPTITATRSGTSITVTGNGFAAGERVTVRLHLGSGPSVTVTASADGNVHAVVTVPAGSAPGRYSVTAAGSSSLNPATATVQTPAVVQ